MSGVTLDVGAMFPLTSFLTAGVVVRILGYENTNNLIAKLPDEVGYGTELKLPLKISIIPLILLIDYLPVRIRKGILFKGSSTNSIWLSRSSTTN